MILRGRDIRRWMRRPFPDKLVVTPVLDPKRQLKDDHVGIDVRLGQDFIVTRTTDLTCIDPLLDKADFDSHVGRSQVRCHVPLGEAFNLHPAQFALGATLEYIRMPGSLAAYVIGRSSWARVGLVIAMATAVHPGFPGVITLELQNLGDVPLALYPGARIAQIIFHNTTAERGMENDQEPETVSEITVLGTYGCQTGPAATRLADDPDWETIRRIHARRQRRKRAAQHGTLSEVPAGPTAAG
jgi:dCTP deaminase